MSRTVLLMLMLALVAVVVMGSGCWWLRRAPPLPDGFTRITPGMTIGQIERLIGQPFNEMESCVGGSFWLEITEPTCGLVTCFDITTNRHKIDPVTQQIHDLPREAQICRRVEIYHWSRFQWLNQQEWAWETLLGQTSN